MQALAKFGLCKQAQEQARARTSEQQAAALTPSKRPRLGFSLPAKIFSAVDFPVPLDPTRPSTWPGRGIGSLQGG
jgi:hypothetical protein